MWIPDETELERAIARESFEEYVRLIAPNYQFSKFHIALADILTRFGKGELTNIIIQAPPQHGKSELFSRLFPGWLLGIHRGIDVLATSYGDGLVKKNARAARRYIETPEYARLFPGLVGAQGLVSTQNEFETTEGGYRAAAIRAGLTGHGGSFILIDDPFKNREEADSVTIRDKVWDEYTSSIITRWRREVTYKGKQIRGGIALTNTRWHEDDLAGRLLKVAATDSDADQWTVFNFPAIME